MYGRRKVEKKTFTITDDTLFLFSVLPLSVIITAPSSIRAGDRIKLTCTTRGSSPPALLAWTIKGNIIKTEQKVSTKYFQLS